MKHIICYLLLFISSSALYACDVCSASSGNQSLGLLPQMYKQFAGIQYQNNTYKSISRPLSDNQPIVHANERYQTVQLWGRVCLGKRWQVFAFLPYQHNTYTTADTTIINSGIGDMSILVNYVFLQSSDSTSSDIQHRLQGGLGIKAPTGKYTGIGERELSGLPNIQSGTGAWDIPININYTVRYKQTGINLDGSYNVTTVSMDQYKYGNKLATQLTGFYWLNVGACSILPQAAVSYEYMLHDYDNYAKKWLNKQTGGYLLSARGGVQVYYNKLGLQLMYSHPISQISNGNNLIARNKIDAGLLFLF